MTLIVGCGVGLLFVFMALVGGLFLYRALRAKGTSSGLRQPAVTGTPAIVVGQGVLSTNVFVEDARLGSVTDIAMGELDPAPGEEVAVAGSVGALFLDAKANVKSAVTFSARAAHVDIIDVQSDGVCEFMNRGSWGIPASVMDHQGKTMWTYGSTAPGVNDMAAGDIDGDGSLEYVVGFNGAGGVHLLETNGTRVWRMPDSNVWHVEMVDADGDGSPEIVHSNAGGEMNVRDRQGNVITQARPGPYLSGFSLCRWPNAESSEYALVSEDDVIWVFDFGGKTVTKLDAPRCGRLGLARAVPVKLRADEPEYFAVAVDLKAARQAILYVHDASGALVYQEVLPESCASIAAAALDGGPTEALLVGGDGKVLRYEAADTE